MSADRVMDGEEKAGFAGALLAEDRDPARETVERDSDLAARAGEPPGVTGQDGRIRAPDEYRRPGGLGRDERRAVLEDALLEAALRDQDRAGRGGGDIDGRDQEGERLKDAGPGKRRRQRGAEAGDAGDKAGADESLRRPSG